jgi:hypothetical protein
MGGKGVIAREPSEFGERQLGALLTTWVWLGLEYIQIFRIEEKLMLRTMKRNPKGETSGPFILFCVTKYLTSVKTPSS